MTSLPELDHVVDEAPREEIPDLLGELERLKVRLLARLVSPRPPEQPKRPDRLLTVDEAAERLATTRDHLYRQADRLPFTVRLSAQQLRFSERGIDEFIACGGLEKGC